MLSINFNPSLLKAQNSLNIANLSLSKSLQRLSTGLRINSAKDDPAGYYVAQGLNSQIKSLKTAQSNVAIGSSLLGVAEGALGSMSTMLNRLSDLALQGAGTTMTDSARGALVKEANALVYEIKKLNTNTTFNGINVFGSAPPPPGNTGVASVSGNAIPDGYTAIYTVDDLKNISNNLSGKYILMNDIDLSSINSWQSIGTTSAMFTGTFDGGGHVIKNLKSGTGGLFGVIQNAEIKNIGLENVNISGGSSANGTGGLINTANSTNTISNCYVTGSITSSYYMGGGLIGDGGSSTISNCYVDATVKGLSYTGGIVGYTKNNFTMTNCYIKGSVSGASEYSDYTGGLVGYQYGSNNKISNCHVSANVSGGNHAGVFLGSVQSGLTVENLCADSSLTGSSPKIGSDGSYGSFNQSKLQLLSHDNFISQSTWAEYDANIWDKSSYPPKFKTKQIPSITYDFSASNEFRLQIGENTEKSSNALYIDTGISMNALEIDLSTTDGCLAAIDCIKAAIDAVAQKTSDIGVLQDRLETISNVNTIKIENLTAAYSTVAETDTAEEVANYTKAQILAQTASTLITQTRAFQTNLILRMINSLG